MQFFPKVLEDWTSRIFSACGVPEAGAKLAASVLVRSELRGYRTHGMTRIVSYVDRLRAGDFNPAPDMRNRAFPGGIVLDADGAMGQIAGPQAIQLGLRALDSAASVLITVRECGHLGALGIYALLAAEAGAFCMLGQRTPPLLALEGFRRAAIGHNPIAFGCPVPGADPLVFDVACSVAARGHILVAAREGKEIPAGWAVDEDGRPTTDAQRALRGALLPMGGHKGIGISMMVECLAGALGASAAALDPSRNVLPESGAVGRQSAFFWIIRPEAFASPEMFARYMKAWTDTYREAGGPKAKLPGSRGVRLEREGHANGIGLSDAIRKELVVLGERLMIPFPMDSA